MKIGIMSFAHTHAASYVRRLRDEPGIELCAADPGPYPDGEVRGAEAHVMLKAWNTGHPGGAATVHANDAVSGLVRLESLVAEARPALGG